MIFLYEGHPLGTWIFNLMHEYEPSNSCSKAHLAAFEKLGGQNYWICLYAALTRCLASNKQGKKPSGQDEAIEAYTSWMEKYPFATVVLAYESQRSANRRKHIETTFGIGPGHPNADLVKLWGMTCAHGSETMLSLAKELGDVSIEIAPDKSCERLWERCKDIWGGSRLTPSILKELAVLAENPRYEGLGEQLVSHIAERWYQQHRLRRASAVDPEYASAIEWIEQRAIANPLVWGEIVLNRLLDNHSVRHHNEYEASGYFLRLTAKLAPHIADENLRGRICMLTYRKFGGYVNLGGPWLYRYLPSSTRKRNRVRAFELVLGSFAPLSFGSATEPEQVTENRNREYFRMVEDAATMAQHDPAEQRVLAEAFYLHLCGCRFGYRTHFLSDDNKRGLRALGQSIKAGIVVRRAVRSGHCDAKSVKCVWRESGLTEADLVRYFAALQEHVRGAYKEEYVGEYAALAHNLRWNLDQKLGIKSDAPNTFDGPGLAGRLLAQDSHMPLFLKARYRIGGDTDLAGIVQLCAGEKGLNWMPRFSSEATPPSEIVDAMWHILTRKTSELPCRMRMLQVFLGSDRTKDEQEPELTTWLGEQLAAHPDSWADLIWLCRNPPPAPARDDWWWEKFGSTPIAREIESAELHNSSIARHSRDRARELLLRHPEWVTCNEKFGVDDLILLAQDWWPAFDLFIGNAMPDDDKTREEILVRILSECNLPDLKSSNFSDEIVARADAEALRERLRAALTGEQRYHASQFQKASCVNWAVRLGLHTEPGLRNVLDSYASSARDLLDDGTLTELLC